MTPGDRWNPHAEERQEREQNERNAAVSGSESSPVSLLGQEVMAVVICVVAS